MWQKIVEYPGYEIDQDGNIRNGNVITLKPFIYKFVTYEGDKFVSVNPILRKYFPHLVPVILQPPKIQRHTLTGYPPRNNDQCKVVGVYDKDNNLIRTYPSIGDASVGEGIDRTTLGRICRELRKQPNEGRIYKPYNNWSENRTGLHKPIGQYTPEGVLIRTFDSVRQATRELNICHSVICNNIKNNMSSQNRILTHKMYFKEM